MTKLLIRLSAIAIIALVYSSCKQEAANDNTVNTSEPTRQQPIPTNKKTDGPSSDTHLNTGGLQWTTFDMLPNNKDNKKYFVDVYTDWCGWCKVMDKKTFTDTKVQEYLNDNFHLVKFNAEQKAPITFKDKIYEWQSGGRSGYNTLAKELMGGRMSYPTMVYLDENMNLIRSIPGYKKPDQLLAELKTINEGS
ncbi:thioredoxin fold domain-containing protein [Saprospiraceae bacterium]|nr:thioredoxin fold domain-containing protein [Saprospiraceae bacterium]